jgi:penicillin-insensitive murein endopeptidase
MVRCLALLLGLSLATLAGGAAAVAQVATDAASQATAQDRAPAAATDKPDAKPETPAAPNNEPAAQADTPTPAPVATTPPADAPGDAVVAPVVNVPAMPAAKPVLVETPLPRDRPEISERTIPAKILFGAKSHPSRGRAQAIGYYPNGCLAGGVELPEDGPTWQVLRLSRNRNWGHPQLVRFIKRWAPIAAKATDWPGILVGDMGQPRGGPTPFGHRSHQTGLDVDIWFRPMPERRLSKEERETVSAFNLVADDWKVVNPKTWTPAYGHLIRTAAEQPEVERVLVNAAIKKELCRLQGKQNWQWMAKVRPWYAHHDHIHVRLKCPPDSPHCKSQPSVPGGDGCEKSELATWFSDKVLHPKPKPGGKPKKEMVLADLPAACKTVLNAPAKTGTLVAGER